MLTTVKTGTYALISGQMGGYNGYNGYSSPQQEKIITDITTITGSNDDDRGTSQGSFTSYAHLQEKAEKPVGNSSLADWPATVLQEADQEQELDIF